MKLLLTGAVFKWMASVGNETAGYRMGKILLPAPLLLLDLTPSSSTGEDLRRLLAAHTLPGCLQYEQVEAGAKRFDQIRVRTPSLVLAVSPSPPPSSFSRLMEELNRFCPYPPVITVLETDDIQLVHEAMKQGVADVLIPPLRSVEVLSRLLRWLPPPRLENQGSTDLKSRLKLKEFIGESPALLDLIRGIPSIARSDAEVIITGETGTGKEICARAIHRLSRRAAKTFYPINCASMSPGLMENELFGHAAGAFTSANTATAGVLGKLEGGTLFLDELNTLSPEGQTKLLRFLEDKVYRAVGSSKLVEIDLRVMAACNVDLEEEVRQGRFRQDLFYRLNVMRLKLPPLRERAGDIELLARHFLQKYSQKFAKPVSGLTLTASRKLTGYPWPGNVRELENVIERAVALTERSILEAKDLDLAPEVGVAARASFREVMAKGKNEIARRYLTNLLRECNGNISEAARRSGMFRSALRKLTQKYKVGR